MEHVLEIYSSGAPIKWLVIVRFFKPTPSYLRNKIFEPFFRAAGTENQSGAGIGLALAYSLAKLHIETLKLDTTDAAMNSFVLNLPIHQE